MKEFFRLHAEMCKTISNPIRLEILNTLRDTKMSATELLNIIKISRANLSQHMGILVQKGVMLSHREGVQVYYEIADKRIIKAYDIMKAVLISKLEKDNKILKSI